MIRLRKLLFTTLLHFAIGSESASQSDGTCTNTDADVADDNVADLAMSLIQSRMTVSLESGDAEILDAAASDYAVVKGSCTKVGSCITSLNYPSKYPAKNGCTVTFDRQTELMVKDFETEDGYDTLTVTEENRGNKEYTGNLKKPPLYNRPLPSLLVKKGGSMTWKVSPWSSGSKGWKFCYEAAVPTPAPVIPAASFAVIPVNWKVIHKKDGTGKLREEQLKHGIAEMNVRYAAVKYWLPDPKKIKWSDEYSEMCDLAHCYQGGTSEYNNIIPWALCADVVAYSGKEQFCKTVASGWGRLNDLGVSTDTGIRFKLNSIKYIEEDAWYEQCCCFNKDSKYEVKAPEIFAKEIDPATARKEVTLFSCNMGGTLGQSMISGTQGCTGGPGIMVSEPWIKGLGPRDFKVVIKDYGPVATLVHEFGHHLGLHHTFNEHCTDKCEAEHPEWCPCGGDDKDVCGKKNIGDMIDDTPTHKKQGACNAADSCPGLPGKDPLDNWMSYSTCRLMRFTPMQTKKMQQVIMDYYPDYLVNKAGKKAKDLPCNPNVDEAGKPPKPIPAGYKPPPKPKARPTPAPAPGKNPAPAPGGKLECKLPAGVKCAAGMNNCACNSGSVCCADHGCGSNTKGVVPGVGAGQGTCLPCGWGDFGYSYSADSCAKRPAPAPSPKPKPPVRTGDEDDKPAPIPAPMPAPNPPAPPAKCKDGDSLEGCSSGKECCKGFGCGGKDAWGDSRSCLPCDWGQFDPAWKYTADSQCK